SPGRSIRPVPPAPPAAASACCRPPDPRRPRVPPRGGRGHEFRIRNPRPRARSCGTHDLADDGGAGGTEGAARLRPGISRRAPRPLRSPVVKNRTFVMCKPDAVERRLVGEVVARLERKGLTLVAGELRTVDRAMAERHYDEHRAKPFFGELVDFLTRSPVLAMVVEGPDDNTWLLVRKLVGATKVEDAEPGTIRGDFATITT